MAKTQVPKKIIFFLWLCWHDKIKNNSFLHKRGMDISTHCYNCHEVTENTNHILRYCTIVKSIYSTISKIVPSTFLPKLLDNSPLQTWLKDNLCNHTHIPLNIPWSTIFAFCCWILWKIRNKNVEVVKRNKNVGFCWSTIFHIQFHSIFDI